MNTSEQVRLAGANLVMDRLAVEIHRLLTEAGIGALLLKGPSVASWLYELPGDRPYVDVDFLVRPSDQMLAEEVLRLAGFQAMTTEIPLNRPVASREWSRDSDGASIDLHTALEGVRAQPEIAWDRVWASRSTLHLKGGDVEVFGETARALHVVLHAAQHGASSPKALGDVDRLVQRLDESAWDGVFALARVLKAEGALRLGLEMRGALPERLSALSVPSDESKVLAADLGTWERSYALGLAWLRSLPWRERFLHIWSKAFPPAEWMRERQPSITGPLSLVLAYARRQLVFVITLPAAVRALRSARKGKP